ncbi:pirin family protein [Rhodococcus sp. 14-2470-1a]|uniref:pirin family protein n=1 Tax=Rhodococcus sp. 14-2470-1a TaxID=2023150 RepID=UPI000B9A542C|nr:pirin family protein [Rhodococcus sp. 14-2470-1a]OZF42030.1 pirin family protein [Rhodococcus sp. 14-2470-1a]
MNTPSLAAGRSISRVESPRTLGPDAQVDNKALIFDPSDPTLTDPFLFFGEDWFSTPGFEWHPHRGVETVTMVVDGVLEHGDNKGHAGALETDDIQWMTAGRGIIHRELAYRNERAHVLQLWLNLSAADKMTDTNYQNLVAAQRPRIERPGVIIDVISGTVEGHTGPAHNHVAVQAVIITIEPGTRTDYALPGNHRAFVHVLSGSADVSGHRLDTGRTAWSEPLPSERAADATARASSLYLSTPDGDTTTRLMIFSGAPLNEPIALGGPFVMNTKVEITKAFNDFHAGKFGPIPRLMRLS